MSIDKQLDSQKKHLHASLGPGHVFVSRTRACRVCWVPSVPDTQVISRIIRLKPSPDPDMVKNWILAGPGGPGDPPADPSNRQLPSPVRFEQQKLSEIPGHAWVKDDGMPG